MHKYFSISVEIPEKFKQFYTKWEYGFVEGLILGILFFISFLTIYETVLLIVIPLSFVFTLAIWFKINNINPIPRGLNVRKKDGRKVCPECGSPARHKKNCSRGKKK